MKRTWTEVGKEHTQGKEEQLAKIFDNLTWQTIPCEMGAGPGLGIIEAVKNLRVPKVSHVADSHELAPYGLMAVKGHYTNGDATIYILDEGHQLVIIATDFFLKEDAGSQPTEDS